MPDAAKDDRGGKRADVAIANGSDRGNDHSRKPYEAPRLQHLGSVRDLTWGSSGPGGDDLNEQFP